MIIQKKADYMLEETKKTKLIGKFKMNLPMKLLEVSLELEVNFIYLKLKII